MSARPRDAVEHDPGTGSADDSPFPRAAPSDPTAPHVTAAAVTVDAGDDRGPLRRI